MKRTYNVIIVGAGLSGLSLAWFLLRENPDCRILIVEKEGRVGGAVRTCRNSGFMVEGGPHGFLSNCRASQDLLTGLGLEPIVQQAPLDVFSRYLCLDGKLRPIPQDPITYLKSNILSPQAKFRFFADLWKKPLPGEPSVRKWAEYRFGPGLSPLVDAALTGTFSGDPERIKIDAIMPGVRQLERKYGSVLVGLFRKQRAAKDRQGGYRLPAMLSFPEGMEQLTLTLVARLLDNSSWCNLLTRHEITTFAQEGNLWTIDGPGGSICCNNLVFALPVNPSLKILASQDFLAAPPVKALPEAPIVNVALGYPDEGQLPAGFGYLAPEQEGRFALGAMFSHNMYPGRAPEGHILLEVLVGGRRHPERAAMDDQTLVERVLQDVSQLLPLSRKPVFCEVIRPGTGIPQLEEGYIPLLEWQKQTMVDNPGLHICGFGYGGIGINDMITEALHTADSISAVVGRRSRQPAAESVYF